MSEASQNEFLLEVGVEEIPAGMMASALAELKRLLEDGFQRLRLSDGAAVSLEVYGTPRRLAARCAHLAARQPSSVEMIQGPPRRVAFGSDGKPTAAATSFAAKMGTQVEKLETVTTPKGEYLAFRRRDPGRPTRELLGELVPQAVLGIQFPRSMYWESKAGPRFIRPIRSLLVLYAGRVVPCAIGEVEAGNSTFGHRLLGKPRLRVRNFAEYRQSLASNYVLLDPQERRARILDGIQALLASNHGACLKPNEELLQTLVYLTEYPTPLMGEFDPAFLALPQEVLITVMKGHQKYLSLEQPDGSLAPRFVAVMELDEDRAGMVRHGHERVLRARFNDARFFWETDTKVRLEERLEKLKHVTFQSQLGSYFDKAERTTALAGVLANALGRTELLETVQTAARLAKCDLTTELVKEFTELQGIVGGLYAEREGLPKEVATAIYDHYKPENIEQEGPRALVGALVALADRLDTLAGCFGVGLAPSGSKDPLGLRRSANGVIKILMEQALRLPLSGLAQKAVAVYEAARSREEVPEWKPDGIGKELKSFLVDRLRYYLRDVRSIAYDEVNAVLAAGDDDTVDAVERAEALAKVRPTENFGPLAIAFKRIKNILEQARRVHGFAGGELDPALLEAGPELQLYNRYRTVSELVTRQKEEGDYWAALEAIASLRPDVDRFFDTVMVMAPQAELRQNRLVLLANLLNEFSTIADFSEVVPAEEAKAAQEEKQ